MYIIFIYNCNVHLVCIYSSTLCVCVCVGGVCRVAGPSAGVGGRAEGESLQRSAVRQWRLDDGQQTGTSLSLCLQ